MTEAFLKMIFEASVTAGIAAAAVMLIRIPLKKAPKRWSYLLWAVVFFRCLCPFSVESTVSLFNAVPDRSAAAEQDERDTVYTEALQTERQETVSEDVQYAAPLPSTGTFYNPYGDYGEPRYADYSGYADFAENENDGTQSIAVNNSGTDAAEADETDNAEDVRENTVSVQTLLLTVWLAGAAVMAAYGTVSYARLMRKIRTAVKTADGVYETDMIPTAFSAGFFPPRVYIPCGLSDTERRLIVTHERVHIRRCDYITKPLAFIALALHWFNPLIWAAFALMTRDMELSCDEAVLKICGAEEKKDYSRALLRVSMKRSGLAVIPLAFAETGIKGRVKNVLGYKKPRVLATVLAAALVFGSCAVLGTNAKRGADDTQYVGLSEGTTEFSGKNGERIFFSFGDPQTSDGGTYYECAFELDGKTVRIPYPFRGDKAANGNLAVHSIISDGTSLSYDDKEFNIGTLVINCVKIDELFVESDGDASYMNVKLRVSADDFDNAELADRLKEFFEANPKDGFEFKIEEAEASDGEYAFDVRADMGGVSGGETVGYSIMLSGLDDIPVYASESLNIVGHSGGDVKSADRVLLEKGTTEFIDENGERILFAYGDNEVVLSEGRKETVLEPYLRYRDADGRIQSHFLSSGKFLGFKGLEAMSSGGGGIDSAGGGIDIDCDIYEITINDIRVEQNDYFYCAAVSLDILADDTLPEKMKCLTWTESCADIDISGGDGRYTVNAKITARTAESGEAEFYALALSGFDDITVYAAEGLNIASHLDGGDADVKSADGVLLEKGTTEFEDENGESVYFAYGDTVTYTSMGETVETHTLPALRYRDESGKVHTFQGSSELKGLLGLMFTADENGRRSSSTDGVDIDCGVSGITVTDIGIKQDNGSYYVSLVMYVLAEDTLPEKTGHFTWYDSGSAVDVDGADGTYYVNADIKMPWYGGNSDWVGSAERGEFGVVLTGFDGIPVYAAKDLKIVGHTDSGSEPKFPIVTEQPSNTENQEQTANSQQGVTVKTEKGKTEFRGSGGERIFLSYKEENPFVYAVPQEVRDQMEKTYADSVYVGFPDRIAAGGGFEESDVPALTAEVYSQSDSGENTHTSGSMRRSQYDILIDADVKQITVNDIDIKTDNDKILRCLDMDMQADGWTDGTVRLSEGSDETSSSLKAVQSAEDERICNIKAEIEMPEGNVGYGLVLTGFEDIPIYAGGKAAEKFVRTVTNEEVKQAYLKKQEELREAAKSSYPSPKLPVAYGDIGEYGANDSHMLFAVPKGTEVLAAADGTVKSAETGFNKGCGNCIEISHVGEMSTFYAYLDDFAVEVGDEVKAGDVIGYSGSSGATVGGALLFEIRMDGKAENPWNYFYLPNDGYQKALDEISKDYTDGGIAGIYNEDGTPVFLISNPALRNSIENFE